MNLKELMAKHKAKQAEPIAIAPSVMDVLNSLSSIHPVSEPASHGVADTANAVLDDGMPTEDEEKGIVESEVQSLAEEFSNTPHDDFAKHQIVDKYGNIITLNDKQWEAVERAMAGESLVLIGPAGTGKTTTMKAVFQALFNAGKLPQMAGHGHKYLPENAPGVSISAFTRRATNNIRRNVSEDLQPNCITIHKLLEYEPQFYTEYDSEKDREVNKMSFEPARNESNPLPESLVCIAMEESSMIGTELFKEIENANPHNPQYIFLGDIQQLPPVFGQAVLGFKMLELPVVELTEVYRQAFDSPILRLAHRILSGKPIEKAELLSSEWQVPGKLKIHPWQKKISAESAVLTLAKFFIRMLDEKEYDPQTDAILIPFNKACGTDELNKHIANKIAKNQEKTVWEVIHGFKKSYFSIGDKVLYDREDAIITNIYTNPTYSGAKAQPESKSLDYWGNKARDPNEPQAKATSDEDVDFILAQVSLGGADDDERVRACSPMLLN
jgi:ATP-dependent exoDNAse (exonuclease V) alpha subunit